MADVVSRGLGRLGRVSNRAFFHLGAVSRLTGAAFFWILVGSWRRRKIFSFRETIRQMYAGGVGSMPIVVLVSALIGFILVIQTAAAFLEYGQGHLVAAGVAMSVTKEMGPLMTAIVVIGRVGAGYSAAIGTMKVNEEILALETMAIDPVGFLVAPRLLGMIIVLPCLTLIADYVAIGSGFLAGVGLFNLNALVYYEYSVKYAEFAWIIHGLVKSAIFAVIITVVSCYRGLIVRGGAEGVGRATMEAVVSCIVLVIMADATYEVVMTF